MNSEPENPGEIDPDDVLFEQAVAAHEGARLEEAESLYRMVLVREPDDAVVHELLGQVLIGLGRSSEASEHLARSVEIDPSSAGAWFARATALEAVGDQETAEAACVQALQIDPHLTGARALLVGLLLRRGAVAEGVAEAERVLSVPQPAEIELRSIAKSALAASQHRLAARALMRIDKWDDTDASAMFDLSGRLFEAGDLGAMDALLRHLHRVQPEHVDVARRLSNHLANHRQEREACEVLRTTLAKAPRETALRLDLADLLDRLGEHEAADRDFALAASERGGWEVRWRSAARFLKPCYESQEQILACRSRLDEAIAEADREIDLRSEAGRREAMAALMSTSFFLLPAQGLCDRDTAGRIGGVIERVVRSIDASLMDDPQAPSASADGRLRVAVLSGFFRSHSNWKTHLGWLSDLDRARIELIGFCTQPARGRELETANRRFDRIEVVTEDPIGLARRIRNERLHAVLIPEIGMDPMVRVVAAARLAPIQWCSWGHATTSGYASVNGYLSAELMETADSDSHYTEPLIRLPGIGGGFVRPEAVPASIHRSSIGVGDGEVAIWCAHAPFTHLPQHDAVLTRIARQCPEARFVFVAMDPGDPTRARIESAFSAERLDPDRFLRFLPRLPMSEFLGHNAACDLYLDTPEWSGCNTGLETILMGCPPITIPGRFMRGRHLWAFLQRLEMPELAAWSVDDYVALAVDMIRDPDRRREAATQIAERREVLFEDPAPRLALETLLEEACRSC